MNDSRGKVTAAAAASAGTDGPLPLSQLLAQILDSHTGDRLRLSELSGLLRDRAWGGLLLIFAAINILPLPPGTTTITGIPLIVLTAQMTIGRATPWFPKRLDRRGITKSEINRLMDKLLPWERRIERIFKPRLCALTNHRAARVIGLVSLILSVILWLPIPLGNHAPAVSMTLFAAALIYRDGVLVLLGGLATLASFALVSVTIGAGWLAFLAVVNHFFPA
ncbi:MAG TPA: exopolysaccharide biosynthesis protein [Sphingomicrobium sp.]|nr:exopolysaccharide biosynthesis protein [Sphingomicrobium sp.]